jgi:cytochrome c-type biogenesis protein CcmF
VTLASFGHYFLLAALAASLLNIGATVGAFLPRYSTDKKRSGVLLTWAEHGVHAAWIFLACAAAILFALFLTDDFSVQYVWSNSSIAQPILYKISAFWGGQGGSLLMWAVVLGTYGLVVSHSGRKNHVEIAPTTAAVICFVNAFFIGLIVWQANPFALIEGPVPQDGFGLNPLLQNPWMQIHPPTLYIGYIGCTVPFAFAVAALLHRRFDEKWVALVRRWTLVTWIILFVGIVLGGVWAYETLGWGGYWAWDPVENASLMPWLVLTAFLHSIMLQGRRGILKNWNMVLVSLTFLLSIFGTFLTRSGIVSSVHSFAESDIGGFFLGFLGVCFVLTFGLIWWRRDELHSPKHIESFWSREGAFVVSNVLWLALTAAILFGTIYPTLYEGMTGARITVEQSYFNRVAPPLALLILALAGIGPLLSWQKTSALETVRKVRAPLWFSAVAIPIFIAPLLYFLGQWSTGAATAFLLVAFLFGAIGSEFYRGAVARRRATGENFFSALLSLPWQNHRRYGGYIVHLGLAIFFVGLTGSSVFKIELEPRDLKIGESMPIGEYTLRFDGFRRPEVMPPQLKSDVATQITILKNGQPLLDRNGKSVFLLPNIEIFKSAGEDDPEAMAGQNEQTARRPAILSNIGHDLYLALIGYDIEKNEATIKAYLNPLVVWIWISVGLFISGTLISLLPERSTQRVLQPRRTPARAPEYSQSDNGQSNGHAINGNGASHGEMKIEWLARCDAEAEIEIAVARLKLQRAQSQAGWRCECGRAMSNSDRFCADCGTPREVALQS